MKVMIIADTANWCFANRARALQQHAPSGWSIDIAYYESQGIETIAYAKYDLIFVLPTNLVGPMRRLFDASKITTPLVASHNSGIGRRHWVLLETCMAADYVIANNHAVWSSTRAMVRDDRYFCCNISNGIDLSTFRVTRPIESRPHRVLWVGSSSKVTEPDDVKGFNDILRPMGLMLNNHPDWEVDYRVAESGAGLNPQEMADWYNTASYVICASKSEGTPNFVLEAAACGCVPITGPVGNVPEIFADGESVTIPANRTVRDFRDALFAARDRREQLSQAATKALREARIDWADRSAYFYALFERIATGRFPPPWSYLELPAEKVACL